MLYLIERAFHYDKSIDCEKGCKEKIRIIMMRLKNNSYRVPAERHKIENKSNNRKQ